MLTHLQKISAPLLRLFITGSFVVLFSASCFSQTQLELAGASYSGVPLGLTTANQTATLLENTGGSTFSTFNPSITVTASISNQQYNNISTSRVSTGKGMSFGGRVNSITPVAMQMPVFNSLNSVDSATNTHFTSNPNGPTSAGIDIADNYGFYFYNSVDELFTNNDAVNGRYYFGNITLTFSQPVSNPVIHIVGLGSNVLFGVSNAQGFSSELELQTSGVSLSKLSGSSEFDVTSNKILNNAAIPTHNCGAGAACGCVKATGTNITTLTFKVYVRGDGNGTAWSHTSINAGDEFMMSVSINTPVNISGNVFYDNNGLGDNTVNGTGTNAGGTLYANLVDTSGKVVVVTAIANDGTYILSGISSGNYTIVLSTTQGVQGAAAPAASLPVTWINTGENIGAGAGNDGTVNGILPITVSTLNIDNANFGIYQCPAVNPVVTANGATTACLGAGLSLSSSIVPNYQWYKDGVAIAGATSQTYIPTVSGTYRMVYTSGGGICSISSNAITVGISYAVTPTVATGDTVNICVANHDKICPAAWGYSNYQWYLNDTLIPAPNGTSSCFYPTISGNYTLTAQNGSGCWSLPSAPVYVVIDSLCSGTVSGGNNGGVESKSLGDVISKRLYGNAYNSIPEMNGYSTSTNFVQSSGTIVNGGSSLKLSDLVPAKANNTTTAYVTTPSDIINFTNAIDVLSVDYTDNSNTKAVVFATKTLGDVYSHTKPICDRLKEGQLLDVRKINVDGYNLITSIIKQRTGEIEYCLNFTIGLKKGRNSYSLQSNWLTDNYSKEDTLYNFQLWAVGYSTVINMAKDVFNKVKAVQPMQSLASSTNDLPKVFVESLKREKANIELEINNPTNATSCSFKILEKVNEDALASTKLINVVLKPNSKNSISIPVSDSYEGNLYLYINNTLNDLVYMSDGSWNIDYNQSNTVIKKFNITNNGYTTNSDEYPLFRKVNFEATTKDYVTAYKLVKGGGIERDFGLYKSIKFKATATGTTNLKITLIKKGITKWDDQYTYTTTVSNIEKEYTISLNQFISKTITSKIDLKDITAINFTWENNKGGSSNINGSVDRLRFSKEDLGYVAALAENELTIYPNPNQGKFKVAFLANEDKPVVLKVVEMATGINVQTQFVSAKKGTNTVAVDLSSMSIKSGLYIITIEGDGLLYKGRKVVVNKP